MAKQTTKKKVTTPEARADVLEEIKNEHDIDALRAEIDRYILAIREKDQIIKNLQTANEQLSHELSEARNK